MKARAREQARPREGRPVSGSYSCADCTGAGTAAGTAVSESHGARQGCRAVSTCLGSGVGCVWVGVGVGVRAGHARSRSCVRWQKRHMHTGTTEAHERREHRQAHHSRPDHKLVENVGELWIIFPDKRGGFLFIAHRVQVLFVFIRPGLAVFTRAQRERRARAHTHTHTHTNAVLTHFTSDTLEGSHCFRQLISSRTGCLINANRVLNSAKIMTRPRPQPTPKSKQAPRRVSASSVQNQSERLI